MEIMQEHLRPAETHEVTPFTEVTNPTNLILSSSPRGSVQNWEQEDETDEQRAGSDFDFWTFAWAFAVYGFWQFVFSDSTSVLC